jgi:hypothetical protein
MDFESDPQRTKPPKRLGASTAWPYDMSPLAAENLDGDFEVKAQTPFRLR